MSPHCSTNVAASYQTSFSIVANRKARKNSGHEPIEHNNRLPYIIQHLTHEMEPSYLLFDSTMNMEIALMYVVAFFGAKIQGDSDTSMCDFVDPPVVMPIDEAIQQGMDWIRNSREFQELRDLDGPFIEKWRDVEWSFDNWDAQEVLPNTGWIQEIADIYYDDETFTRAAY